MGLQLNTAVGYSLVDQQFYDDGNVKEIDRYYGNGGTNRVFLGYGYRFPFDLSLGAELAFFFVIILVLFIRPRGLLGGA